MALNISVSRVLSDVLQRLLFFDATFTDLFDVDELDKFHKRYCEQTIQNSVNHFPLSTFILFPPVYLVRLRPSMILRRN